MVPSRWMKQWRQNLTNARQFWRTHRGVTTKLTREIDEMLALESLTKDHHTTLKALHQQLKIKSVVLVKLDIYLLMVNWEILKEGSRKPKTTVAKILSTRWKVNLHMQSLNIYAHSLLRTVTEPLLVDIIALRVKTMPHEINFAHVQRWCQAMNHLLGLVQVHNTCTNSHLTKIDLFTQLAERPSSKSYQTFDFNRHKLWFICQTFPTKVWEVPTNNMNKLS